MERDIDVRVSEFRFFLKYVALSLLCVLRYVSLTILYGAEALLFNAQVPWEEIILAYNIQLVFYFSFSHPF